MAGVNTDQTVKGYIDGANSGDSKQQLKTLLRSTSAKGRLDIIKDKRGVAESWSVLHQAAWVNDIDNVKEMLKDLPEHEIYSTVEKPTTSGDTVVHIAAANGYTNLLGYILDRLSLQHRLNLLELQNSIGDTPLHRAAEGQKPDAFSLLLSSVEPKQQLKLLNMKNKQKKSVIEVQPNLLYLSAAWAAKELISTRKEVAALRQTQEQQERVITRQDEELIRTRVELDGTREEVTALRQSLQQQERVNTRQDEEMARMRVRQEEMQRLIEHLEKYIQTPFATDATGDQEHED